jgi:Asp-tRNA(Asn)/Glu-tRNA(Gln) amidotransferase A subunit family amidase
VTLDLLGFTARRISDGIAAREFSAAEVVEAAYARIDEVEPSVHAFNQLTRDLAEQAAGRVDETVAAGGQLPALAGVPVGIKDNMNLVGTRTTCSARILEGYESRLRLHRGAPTARRRRAADRQVQHGRVRVRLIDRELGVRPDAQPLGPRAGARAARRAARRRA